MVGYAFPLPVPGRVTRFAGGMIIANPMEKFIPARDIPPLAPELAARASIEAGEKQPLCIKTGTPFLPRMDEWVSACWPHLARRRNPNGWFPSRRRSYGWQIHRGSQLIAIRSGLVPTHWTRFGFGVWS